MALQKNINEVSYWSAPGLVKSNREVASPAEKILGSVASAMGVSLDEVKTRTRRRVVVYVRQVACHLIRKHTELTLREIGRAVGCRDYTSVIHSIQTLRGLLEVDSQVRREVLKIEAAILQRYF
jgi:chromosomal replication initiator protein